MDDLFDRIIELSREGYCCSQILFLLAQDMHNRENNDLIRAMGGLCNGMYAMDFCGTLSAACCLIAYYTGTGQDYRDNPAGKLIIKEYMHWFKTTYSHATCLKLVGSYGPEQEQFCAKLIGDCFIKCMEMLGKHNVDIYMEN